MQTEILLNTLPWIIFLVLGVLFFNAWMRERRFDREMRHREFEMQRQREKEETERMEKERERERSEANYEQYLQKKLKEEEKIKREAGLGSGGYIILDLPDDKRGLFHDLLKGFEEYARLQGYSVSFSVDNTFHEKIAFKFTLTDPDVVVRTDRVRKDLKEYLEKVSAGDPFNDLPQIISLEEHELLVTTLRNRLSFLQHNYNLAKNSIEFYEGLIKRATFQALLPSPNVVVQTGGAYNSPSYSSLNSPQAVIGMGNHSEGSAHISFNYNERKDQIDQVSEVLRLLEQEQQSVERDDAVRNLKNVKEELEQVDPPESRRVTKWLQQAKQAAQLGKLGYETIQAVKELFNIFGLS
ncbi:hypothetical protein [Desulfobacter sp.]|uniref:hypothetical protein n=1 Tax=Desulfobacter sp. TaxID=2294 RepID=UPI00257AC3BE|nr:hypothetical protein [Desulfobacter sp.]